MILRDDIARLLRAICPVEFRGQLVKLACLFPALAAEVFLEQRALVLRAKTHCSFAHAFRCAALLHRRPPRPRPRDFPRRSVLN